MPAEERPPWHASAYANAMSGTMNLRDITCQHSSVLVFVWGFMGKTKIN